MELHGSNFGAYSAQWTMLGQVGRATVVSMVDDGMSTEEICRDLPDLTPDDVAEAPALRR